MRAPVDTIPAPPFLTHLRWVNVKSLRMDRQIGRPVLIEFWDFCRPNSMRTVPYLKAWHERYAEHPPAVPRAHGGGAGEEAREETRDGVRDEAQRAAGGEQAGGLQAVGEAQRAAGGEQAGGLQAVGEAQRAAAGEQAGGLQVVGIHSPGFEPARERHAVEAAVARLEIPYPVLLDPNMEMWREYENEGWPARYLFDGRGRLFDYHYGEGAYEETELAIQELLGIEREPLPALRPEDAPDARLVAQSEDREGAYSGPYEAGGVWVVLDGSGVVRAGLGSADGVELSVSHPGAYVLIEHRCHTVGVLELEVGPGVECLATCFTPGLAPADE